MSSQKEALGALVSIQALKPGRYLDGRPLGTPGAAGMGSDMELTGLLGGEWKALNLPCPHW